MFTVPAGLNISVFIVSLGLNMCVHCPWGANEVYLPSLSGS